MHFFLRTCVVVALCIASALSHATEADQTASSTNTTAAAAMSDLEAQVRTGKRAFVAEQLELTPKEAEGFWPLYEDYQTNLSAFNQRRLQIILSYADQYNAGDMQDAPAIKLSEQALQLEKDEAEHMSRAFQKIRKVLPGVKAARYLQVEGKIRAVVRYEQAAQVPYAQ